MLHMDLTGSYKQTRESLFKDAGTVLQSKTADTNGPVKTVHYYETGTGNPVIIIHGGGSHALQTYPLINALGQHFHLYIPDRPGCGLTDSFNYDGVHIPDHAADFIRSFMDAAGIDKASIVASSVGGLFAISFALKYPERIEKLLFIGHPTGLNRKIPLVLRLLGTRGINKLLMKMTGPPTIKSTRQFYAQLLVVDPAKLSDEFLENDLAAALLPDAGESFISLIENCMALGGLKKEYLLSSRMAELSIPVYFIIGDQDKFNSPENLKNIAAAMPNAKVEIVKDGGHILWLDQPEACGEAVIRCLSS